MTTLLLILAALVGYLIGRREPRRHESPCCEWIDMKDGRERTRLFCLRHKTWARDCHWDWMPSALQSHD